MQDAVLIIANLAVLTEHRGQFAEKSAIKLAELL
jgi:hypothetical protein